jgi:hypothetical protein
MTTPNPHRPATSGSHEPLRRAFDRLRIDHTHTRYHHRLAHALAHRLPTVLEHDEKVLGFTEAIEDSELLTKATLGFGWPLWRRVALLFTDRRLLEVGLACCGRRASGRVRSFPWDRIPGFDSDSRVLEVATWQETDYRWRLREPLAAALKRALRHQVDLAVSTYQPSQGLSVPIRQCGRCGSTVRAPRDSCGRCGTRVRSSRLAGILAMVFPGAGHLYAGHWVAAALRLGVEMAVFGWLASRILAAGTLAEIVTPIAAGLVAIGIVKLQGVAVARRLSARAELVTPHAERRWRWFAAIAGPLSVAALLVPLLLAGQTDTDINLDLDFIVSEREWTGYRASPTSGRASVDDAIRSQWLHREGLKAEVRAWPMRPFESSTVAQERYVADTHGAVETLVLGPHHVVASRADDGNHTTLRYAVVDSAGRDLHVVSADVLPEHVDHASSELESLISRGIWIPPAQSQPGR